ncbi:MAG: hypothetical protein LQ340_001345 [Diploschistes diacapsis]|nr:MAG: hypothetical protein LQ340_001345 [Diploschistes diacapsis]
MATAVKNAVSKATGKVKTTIRVPLEFGTEHGHQIFVYHNIRTHQIIYSLTRSMRR